MELEILKVLLVIKKELQDTRIILEQKEIKIMIGDDVFINALNEEMKKRGNTLISV